jgi:phospholipid-transporting ATPase
MALVIDGKSLDFALEEDVKDTFLELALLCKAVVCCRVTPLQKALVVKLVKDNVAGAVTLAIGDGANDVSMIQAAHVGVGISGMEGLQAVRSSDFAIAQFRYLKKLLLTHGGWGYSRVCKVVVICFYKNITLYLIQFWFALNNNFSGMTLFETWSSVSSYNVIWTLLPPLAIGIFDQYVSARMLDRYPQMYKSGQSGAFYNHKIFIGWILNSFFHSLMLFYLWTWVLQDSDILSNGLVADNWAFGTMVYVTTIITVLIKHCLIVDSYVSFTVYSIFGSFGVFMVFFPLYSTLGPLFGASPELLGVSHAMFYCLPFWLSLIVFPIMINLRDIIWKYVRRSYLPENYHIVQEIQKYNIPDYRPRQEHFRKQVHKVRQIQRIKQTRGFAFSQNESGQAGLIRSYDTTLRKPKG